MTLEITVEPWSAARRHAAGGGTPGGRPDPTPVPLPGLPPSGACRMSCRVEGQRGLVPSSRVSGGRRLKVQTHSARAVDARRTLVELLLANHPDDCLYCARNGECRFRTSPRRSASAAATTSAAGSRRAWTWRARRSPGSGEVHPVRQVRARVRGVQAVGAIDFIGRGSKTRIGPAFDEGLNVSSCINCGQCVAACRWALWWKRGDIRGACGFGGPLDGRRRPARAVGVGEPGRGVRPQSPERTSTARSCGVAAGSGFAWCSTRRSRRTSPIMEEHRSWPIGSPTGGVLPMMTSSSPGWVKFV